MWSKEVELSKTIAINYVSDEQKSFLNETELIISNVDKSSIDCSRCSI